MESFVFDSSRALLLIQIAFLKIILTKPVSVLLGGYSHCNQHRYNINKLKRIELLLINTTYSRSVACLTQATDSEIPASAKSEWGRYTLVAWKQSTSLWSERKGKKLSQILFLCIFQHEVSQKKNVFLEKWSKLILCTLVLLVLLVNDVWISCSCLFFFSKQFNCLYCLSSLFFPNSLVYSR